MLVFVLEALAPTVASALTSGPSQPEFSGFEPVGTTGLVNEATGGFSYSIPVIQVPGPGGSTYPLTLSYHSNVGVEEDASWVGYGWTLNAGAINRNVRGIPDDINGDKVIQYHSQPLDETFSVGNTVKPQAASIDAFEYSNAVTYNTRSGYSIVSGLSLTVGNLLALDLRRENGRMRFEARPNWAHLFSMVADDWLAEKSRAQLKQEVAALTGWRRVVGEVVLEKQLSDMQVRADMFNTAATYITNLSVYSTSKVTNPVEFSGEDLQVNFGATIALPGLPIIVGAHGGVRGTYSVRRFTHGANADEHGPANTGVAEYGYMYQNAALLNAGATSAMDYSVQSESAFDTRDRYISPTYPGHDLFAASGQGVSGVFRLWQTKPGAYRPREVSNTKVIGKLDTEAGLSLDKVSAGTKAIGIGYDVTTIKRGIDIDPLYRHEGANRTANAVFARMSNDPADSMVYYASNEPQHALNTAKNYIDGAYLRINNLGDNKKRPRSSTTIQFRTNSEMLFFQRTAPTSVWTTGLVREVGLSIGTSAPKVNSGVQRSEEPAPDNNGNYKDRIGEMALTTSSGIKYIYGLPVYSCNERNLQFMGRRVSDDKKGTIFWNRYKYSQELGLSDKGSQVSGTFRKAPYASSHLITEVHTPDYVDLTNNGPTEDDLGGWTTFGYRKVAGGPTSELQGWYRWRSPYSGFYYHAGSHTTGTDDRATVSSGYRELYYLKKIETKTHIAFFVTNMTNEEVVIGGSGSPLPLVGSQAGRMDAWEAYNTGKYTEDEKVSAVWQDRALLPALYAGSQHASLMGKLLGGRRSLWSPWNDPADPLTENISRKNKSEYLEKIILVAKKSGGGYEVLQTVNLEYSYELQEARAVPDPVDYEWDQALEENVSIVDPDKQDTSYWIRSRLNSSLMFTSEGVDPKHTATRMNVKRFGKLTLKRLWTDFGAAKRADIAPYEFDYLYRNESKDPYPGGPVQSAELAGIRQFGGQFCFTPTTSPEYMRRTLDIQNPKYDPIAIDPWGMYRSDGGGATQGFRSHLNQRQASGTGFDPAAWQLKVIRLPSGGEIHVHYEANTYAFVQDQPAMAFVQLKDVVEDPANPGQWWYELNLGSTSSGLNMTTAEVADRIKDYVRRYRQRIYFKFLAKVQPSSIQPTDAKFPFFGVDYIVGHSDVSPDDVREWTAGAEQHVGIRFNDDYTPNELAREFALTHRLGYVPDITRRSQYDRRYQYRKMTVSMKEEESDWLMPAEVKGPSKGLMEALMQSAGAINDDVNRIETMFRDEPLRPVNAFSYIRIPCGSKRGAGVRVKRIVMYDPGIEADAAAIYGSEYLYETTVDGRTVSSGVVSNEPGEIRDESALTTYLVGRDDRNFLDKLAAGDDLEQMEGPLCANAYPSPQLVYSRVVTRPIRSDLASAPGFVVTEFNTARDYPVIVKNTDLDPGGIDLPPISPSGSPLTISGGSKTVSQGYTIILNAMHGTPKRVTSYGGKYSDPASWTIVESTEFEYYKPGDEVLVLDPAAEGNGYPGKISKTQRLGVDMDVALETRSIKTEHIASGLPFDAGIQFPLAFFAHVGLPIAEISTNQLTLRSLTKIVSSNVIPKRTVTMRDGMIHIEENVVFDAQSGKPCIVRSYDDMYRAYQTTTSSINANPQQSYTIPASLIYPEMRSKSFNDMLTMECKAMPAVDPSTSALMVELKTTGDAKYISNGDLVRIGAITTTPMTDGARFCYVTNVDGVTGKLTLVDINGSGAPAGPVTSPYYLTVMESGRQQLLDAQAGSILQYASSVHTTNTLTPLVNVIKASAITYKDTWHLSPPANAYEAGKRGKWRPEHMYTWKDAVYSVFDPSPSMRGNYENGYAASFIGFPYVGAPASQWVRVSTINTYDLNGVPVSETDALDIPSVATYTKQMLPSMIARNAQEGRIFFNSFEYYESPATGTPSTTAHTGKQVFSLGTSPQTIVTMPKGNRPDQYGLVMQYWVQSADANPVTVTIDGVIRTSTKMGHAGEWALFQVLIPDLTAGSLGTTYPVVMKSNSGTVAVDDIRIQPELSEATCYVYDAGQRLVAQFDDRHFGVIYQYTPEGRLAYKKRETERGMLTVEERQYNTPRTNRTTQGGGVVPGALVMQSSGRRVFNGPAVPVDMGMPGRPASAGAKGSVLDLKVSPTRRTIRLFDGDTTNVPDLDSLRRSIDTLMNKNGKESR